MAIYAIAIMAVNTDGKIVSTALVANKLRSLEEAEGAGLRTAREQWAQKDGWHGHQATALEIPEEWYNDNEG